VLAPKERRWLERRCLNTPDIADHSGARLDPRAGVGIAI
jgi:hypothetical protein